MKANFSPFFFRRFLLSALAFGIPLFFILSACHAGESRKGITHTIPGKICTCTLNNEEMSRMLPVAPDGDSIIVCKTGTIRIIGSRYKEAVSWPTALSDTGYLFSSSTVGQLFNCKDGVELKTSFYECYIRYSHKKLIAESIFTWDSLTHKGEWLERVRPVYRETFYAQEGEIRKTAPEMILVPPVYDQAAVALVHEQYKKAPTPFRDNYVLQKRLLVAALNGDGLSRRILLQYQPDQTEESIRFYIRILKGYLQQ